MQKRGRKGQLRKKDEENLWGNVKRKGEGKGEEADGKGRVKRQWGSW